MKTFEETFNSLSEQARLEIASYLKYKTLPERDICARYNVTSWWLNNFKLRLGFLPNPQNDNIVNDFNHGCSIEDLKMKYGLEESRIRQIINNHRLTEQSESKKLF